MTHAGPVLVQWIVDVRNWWQIPEGLSREEAMKALKSEAVEALSLLTDKEKEGVLRYYFVKDAKMSLASHLLKHFVVAKLCHVPWSESVISRRDGGKPCYRSNSASSPNVDFNVSHQAGIVSLVACSELDADVGTDVVCVNERGDYAFIEKEGFFAWVDIHSEVFASSEVEQMKFDTTYLGLPDTYTLLGYGRDAVARCQHRHRTISWRTPDGQVQEINSNIIIDAKLRRFYAFWCLREAYVKMTGEALLADWLRELSFQHFRVPIAAEMEDPNDSSLVAGEVVNECEITFRGKKVCDVAIELRALGRDYMVASMVRSRDGYHPKVGFPGYTVLQLEKDIVPMASH